MLEVSFSVWFDLIWFKLNQLFSLLTGITVLLQELNSLPKKRSTPSHYMIIIPIYKILSFSNLFFFPIFRIHHNHHTFPIFLPLWDNEVTAKDNVKYLGVSLDQSLGGKYIAESILKKGNSRLKFLWRQAKYLNRNSRKLLATSLILCHFDYACSA